VLLWGHAYRVNPRSCINGAEWGMALTNADRPRDAIPVRLSPQRSVRLSRLPSCPEHSMRLPDIPLVEFSMPLFGFTHRFMA
jgi:hypothetical protein